MKPDPAPVARDALMEVSRQLSLVVLSLDHLGSTYADDRERLREALGDFTLTWSVGLRLAYARRIVDEALEQGLTERESLEMETRLQMPSWREHKPDPPGDLAPPPRPS